MTPDGHDPNCAVDLGPAVALFRSLADPTRLAIVHELTRGERRIVDLTKTLGWAQSTVSAHVACLRDCGLVDVQILSDDARGRMYRLRADGLVGMQAWLDQMQAFWSEQMGAFKERAERGRRKPSQSRSQS